MNKNTEGGYAGLIALLVIVAIMGFVFVKLYLTPKHSSAADPLIPLTASGTQPTTGFEEAHAEVDAAKAAQSILNAHNAETNATLSE